MAKIRNSTFWTKRRIKKLVKDEKGVEREKLVSIDVLIHYNAEIPSTHRMLR